MSEELITPRSIKTDQPSTGRPVAIRKLTLEQGANALYQVPNFDIPQREEDSESAFVDANNVERQLVPGEGLFIMPLNIANTSVDQEAIVQLFVETEQVGEELPLKIPFTSQLTIPLQETVQIPINGLSLLRSEKLTSRSGDMLVLNVVAPDDIGESLSVYTIVSEAEAGTHAPDFET
jgi:hypothetical protein